MKDVIKLIKEEFAGFLNELEDNEAVDPRTINLEEEFNILNKLLFNGSLKNVPMKWDNAKGRLGVVRARRNRFTGAAEVEHLAMSGFYKFTYRAFKDTLAHEMIHVWQYQTRGIGDHGWSFHDQGRRINSMGLGFKITVRNDEPIEISDETKAKMAGKTFIALIMKLDGNYGLELTSPNVFLKEKDVLFNFLNRLVNERMKYRNIEVTVVETSEPQLARYRVARSFQRGFGTAKLSDEMRNTILQNGKVMGKFSFVRGSVPSIMNESEEVSAGSSGEWETVEISMKVDSKTRLFEVMRRVVPNFTGKALNEEITPTIDKYAEQQKNADYLPITCVEGSPDDKLFTEVVNQGIDSHLEGFVKSKFEIKNASSGNRRVYNFHRSEIPILLRRLEEIGSDEALQWKDDIENYGNTPVFK